MNGKNGKQGSCTLAVVAGGLLIACTVGVRLLSANAAPDPRQHNGTGGTPRATVVAHVPGHASPFTPRPTAVRPPVTDTPDTKPATFGGATGGHGTIPHTVTTVTVPPSTPATPSLGQEYRDPATGYRLSYPSDWRANDGTPGSYIVSAPDTNALVEVDVRPSAPLDAAGLKANLDTAATSFLYANGLVLIKKVYNSTTVDGQPAEVVGMEVYDKQGVGTIYMSDVYYNGRVYYGSGAVANNSTSTAQQDNAQVQNVMSSFRLY